MSFHIKAGLTALALILAPLAVAAHHKDGHGGGNGGGHSSHEERGNRNHDRTNDDADEVAEEEEAVEEATGGRPCAWGLANRDTPCVPPGQAKRGVSTDEWIGAPETTVDATTALSGENVALLDNTDRLPDLEEGQSYALVGDAVVVVNVVEGLAEDGSTVTTYEYVSTYGRAAFPGQSVN